MLERAEAEASERGYRRISLGTRALYVEAVRLYERRGLDARPRPAAAGPTASTTATSSRARPRSARAAWRGPRRARQLLALGVVDGVVARVGVALLERRELLLHGVEARVDVVGERGVLGPQCRREQPERRLRAVDVGLEVTQVGVRVAILLAADLRRGDLVEQAVRAVRELVRLVGERPRLGLERPHVGEQLVGDRLESLGRVLLPQRLLDAMEARPRLALLDVVDARVDVGIEVAEALRDRLDRLVGHARGRELLLGLLDVTRLDGGDERLDLRSTSILRLRRDVALVAGDGAFQQRVGGARRPPCRRP